MRGEAIIARSIAAARIKDAHGNTWQYHSRSDRHSKVASWAVMFDLMRSCELLRSHVAASKVGFGINHELRDFRQNKKKNLDLVLSRRARGGAGPDFTTYGAQCGVVLLPEDIRELEVLPRLEAAEISNVLLALEAKACMTEHGKAQPRLHDELDSSYRTIHGDTNSAMAAGFVMINSSESFISSDRNRKKLRKGAAVVTLHKQPAAARVILAKVMQIPRRSDELQAGFDAVGVTVLKLRNDHSEVSIDTTESAVLPDIVRYPAFIHRLSHLYSTKYGGI